MCGTDSTAVAFFSVCFLSQLERCQTAQRKYTLAGSILNRSAHKQGRLLVSLTAYVVQIFSEALGFHMAFKICLLF